MREHGLRVAHVLSGGSKQWEVVNNQPGTYVFFVLLSDFNSFNAGF